MGETKRIMISLPQKLLMEVDGIVALENRTRSEFIREAMKLYLQERKKDRSVNVCRAATSRWQRST